MKRQILLNVLIKDWVDEIIIVDSGSTDNTQEIAEQYGAKFYSHPDWPGFGKQRQRAQQYVTSDYVLWLDADERVTPKLRESIQQAVQQDAPNTVYDIPRVSEVFGREIRHSGWYPDYVVRLYRTNYAGYNDSLVHEKVVYPDYTKVQKLTGDLEHFTYKSIHHYLVKSADYAKACRSTPSQRKKSNIAARNKPCDWLFYQNVHFKSRLLRWKTRFSACGTFGPLHLCEIC